MAFHFQLLHARLATTRGRLVSHGLLVLLVALACSSTAPAARAESTGTLVQINIAGYGSVQIDLFDELVPTTVDNFLGYINTNSYDGTIIHRVDTGLGVIQGGGFDETGSGITTNPSIPLEYHRANSRGTIAMARSTALDSATSQWFINTDDNSSSLGQSNNGGYAVFGWVVGPGMSVVDGVAATPTFAYNAPFGQIPLTNFTQDDFDNGVDPTTHTVMVSSIEVLSTHPAFQNPYLRGDVDNDGLLKPRDLLQVIDDLAHNGNHDLTGPFDGSEYMDVNGDGRFSAADLSRVISDLLDVPAVPLQFVDGPLMPSLDPGTGVVIAPDVPAHPLFASSFGADPAVAVVPEPASCALGAAALVAVAGLAIRARRQNGRRRG